MSTTANPVVTPAKVSFWQSVGNFFHHAETLVSSVFVKLFGAPAAHNFAIAAESVLLTDLGKIAMTAVQNAQKLASGVEKRAAAFSAIGSAAKSAGIDAKDSVINMLIEMAVQKVNGMFGPAATPAGS